jgi:hypothetical protein
MSLADMQRIKHRQHVPRELPDAVGALGHGRQPMPAKIGADDAKAGGQRVGLGVPNMQAGAQRVDEEKRRRAWRAGDLNMDVQIVCADEHAASRVFAVID